VSADEANRDDAADVVIVALDGPSGVGKSTVARLVAQRLGLSVLDTGSLYRAMALRVLDAGVDPRDEEAVAALTETTEIEVVSAPDGGTGVRLQGVPVDERLRQPEVSRAASLIAGQAAVRACLLGIQRTAVVAPGAVVEGRDIGTVVFPETPHKFFLDARAEVRARRRLGDLRPGRPQLALEQVQHDIEQRDRRDRERANSPLRAGSGYELLDASDDDAATVAERIVTLVGRASAGATAPGST
jgi:cytidylate kinase